MTDLFYSIDTVIDGTMPPAAESCRYGDANVNGPVSYWILRAYLDYRKIGPKEVFYDIGCGHGRVLCVVAQHRVEKCFRIELSKEFSEKARANALAVNVRASPIEVRVGDGDGLHGRYYILFWRSLWRQNDASRPKQDR